ncbi:cell division site-positioning protein MapZ family protein [Streptococcus didelphis]|nr:cell division site-positioning protein MapZ family protein [Streptococcus didelphis]
MEQKKSKKKKLWFLFILLLLILGLVFGLTFLRQSNTNSKTSSRQTSQSKSSIASKEAEKADSFNKAYKEFFTDKNQTKLKNDSFDKLDKLEENLQKLKNTSYYEKAKTKFDSLKKQISAIQAVNAKFSSDAIKNGEKVTASVKDNANFDDLKSETLKTGNARLDKLLQTVIDSGRKQVSDKTKLAQEKASQEAQAQAKAEEENKAKKELFQQLPHLLILVQ